MITSPQKFTQEEIDAFNGAVYPAPSRHIPITPPTTFLPNLSQQARIAEWHKIPAVTQQLKHNASVKRQGDIIKAFDTQAFSSPDIAAQDAAIKFDQIQAMGGSAGVGLYNAVVRRYNKAVASGASPVPRILTWYESRLRQIAIDSKTSGITTALNFAVPIGLAIMTGGTVASAAGIDLAGALTSNPFSSNALSYAESTAPGAVSSSTPSLFDSMISAVDSIQKLQTARVALENQKLQGALLAQQRVAYDAANVQSVSDYSLPQQKNMQQIDNYAIVIPALLALFLL